MPANRKVVLVYKFEDVDSQLGIDVFKAGPLFISLGELIKEANLLVGANPADIGINIKPSAPGSFIQELLIFAPSWYTNLTHLVNNTDTENLKQILEWLGLIQGAGLGLIGFVKWGKGRWDSVEQAAPNEYRYTLGDQSIVVAGNVHTLIQSPTIQTNVKNVFYTYPREIAGSAARLSTYDAEQPQESRVEISSEDVESFGTYSAQSLLDADVNENIGTFLIKPKHGSYRGDRGPYSFFLNGSTILSPVYIEDEAFLVRLTNGEVRMHEQDTLRVRLRSAQRLTVSNEIHTVHYIEEVIEYVAGSRPSQSEFTL